MTQSNRSNEPKGFLDKLKQRLKNNHNTAQFLVNVVLSILTFLALITTIVFSIINLNANRKQYQLADSAFRLSQKQFDSTLVERKQDIARQKERDDLQDLAVQKEQKLEKIKNAQDSLYNLQQLKAITNQAKSSERQAIAAKNQANTSQQQFDFQQQQYKQQYFENRPIFNIDSVLFYNPTTLYTHITFVISNRGVRTPRVDSLVIAFYNPTNNLLCFNSRTSHSDINLISDIAPIRTSSFEILKECATNSKTMFYILFYYVDTNTGRSQVEPLYFTYHLDKTRGLTIAKIAGDDLKDFKNELRRRKVILVD